MSSIPELPQPGVQVIQEFRQQTPTIVIPTLVPCNVGVAKEIREVFDSDGTLNTDILVSGPAIARSPNDDTSFTAMSGKTLEVRVNGGPLQTFTMPAQAALTATEVAQAINGATPAPVDFAAYAVQDGSSLNYLELRTTAAGEDKTILIVGGTLIESSPNQLGYGVGYTYYGLGGYIQDRVQLPQTSFPDPRSNLDELDIEEDSIRVFLDLSTEVREILRTEAYLRAGSSIAPVDDADGDQTTPYVSMGLSEDFKASPTSAIVTGTEALNVPKYINQQTLAIQLDGAGKQFVKFYGAGIISDDSAGWVWGNVTGNALDIQVNGVTVSIAAVTAANIGDLVTEINAASVAQTGVGVAIAYRSDADGSLNAAGTYLGLIYGAVPTTIDRDAAIIVLNTSTPALLNELYGSLGTTGTGDDITQDTPVAGTATLDDAGGSFTSDMVGKSITIAGAAAGGNNGTFPITAVNSGTQIEITNASAVTVVGDGFTYIVHGAVEQPLEGDYGGGHAFAGGPFENIDIEAQIDEMFGSTVASINGSNYLVLTSPRSGEADSKIEILASPDSTTTLLTALGLTAGVTFGNPFNARVGDYLYADGAFVGMITEVHPTAVVGRLKLDREVSISASWSSWYIIAKNLDTVPSTQWGTTVPRPDLQIDNNGDVIVKHDFLRDTTGSPIVTTNAGMYVAYDALRLDVSADAESPALLTFDTSTELEAALDPVTPDNPLAYGTFVCLGNANGVRVAALGVGETSSDKPYGTVNGFQAAFEFLESKEVYGLAILTSDLDIATIAQTHVDSMSEPEQKGERIAVVHLGVPTRKVDTIAVSGTDGDSVAAGAPPYYFDTKIATLSQALLALNIDPTNITVADGVFLDIASDSYNWNISGSIVNGTQVKINTTFAVGENDDAFYHETIADWVSGMPLVSESFSVKVRGAAISTKTEEIETIYNRGAAFADRRVWMEQLDQLRASVGGIDQLVAGFFMNSAKVGMVAGLNPSQPLTNFPIAVFTGVTGSNDRYSNSQLNQGASGGAEWIIQAAEGAALTSRMQVTTDLTTIEKREQSIVKAVDYCAKFYRISLRKFIGRFNITNSYLDTLSSVVQGLSRWLVEEGFVVLEANLNNILQDADNPDTLLIDVSLEVFYPGNYIRLTLIV